MDLVIDLNNLFGTKTAVIHGDLYSTFEFNHTPSPLPVPLFIDCVPVVVLAFLLSQSRLATFKSQVAFVPSLPHVLQKPRKKESFFLLKIKNHKIQTQSGPARFGQYEPPFILHRRLGTQHCHIYLAPTSAPPCHFHHHAFF